MKTPEIDLCERRTELCERLHTREASGSAAVLTPRTRARDHRRGAAISTGFCRDAVPRVGVHRDPAATRRG